jgi:hypothetical protein
MSFLWRKDELEGAISKQFAPGQIDRAAHVSSSFLYRQCLDILIVGTSD